MLSQKRGTCETGVEDRQMQKYGIVIGMFCTSFQKKKVLWPIFMLLKHVFEGHILLCQSLSLFKKLMPTSEIKHKIYRNYVVTQFSWYIVYS